MSYQRPLGRAAAWADLKSSHSRVDKLPPARPNAMRAGVALRKLIHVSRVMRMLWSIIAPAPIVMRLFRNCANKPVLRLDRQQLCAAARDTHVL